MTYRVRWEIDVDADSPQEAAKTALVIQRDPESWATVFDVIWYFGNKVRLDVTHPEFGELEQWT